MNEGAPMKRPSSEGSAYEDEHPVVAPTERAALGVVAEANQPAANEVFEDTPEAIAAELEGLKTTIAEINAAVQNGQMDTVHADEQVAALEREIYELETKQREGAQEQVVETAEQDQTTVAAEDTESAERREYLRLKHSFKAAERRYHDALRESELTKGLDERLFGFGREKLPPDVQAAYDTYMEANQAYYAFANQSGMYQKISDRINREHAEDEQVPINGLVADRHVLRPAERRLELQTMQLPESIRNLKKKVVDTIKKHPKVAATAAIGAAFFNPAGVLAGLGARYVGNKEVAHRTDAQSASRDAITEVMLPQEEAGKIDANLNLAALEAEYFQKTNRVQRARTGTKAATVGAAVAAGSAWEVADAAPIDSSSIESTGGSEQAATVPEAGTEQFTEGIERAIEHEVVPGEVLSEVLHDHVRELVDAGVLQVPSGVEAGDGVTRLIYETFPEMTDATDAPARLSLEQWRELGIESGNPHDIQPGERIDLTALTKLMADAQEELTAAPTEVAENYEQTPADASITESTDASSVVEEDASAVVTEPASEAVSDAAAENAPPFSDHEYAVLETAADGQEAASAPLEGGTVSADYEGAVLRLSAGNSAEHIGTRLVEIIRDGAQSGRLELPAGVDPNSEFFAGFLFGRMPELYGFSPAIGEAPALTLEQWHAVGLRSLTEAELSAGHIAMHEGDVLDLSALLEIIVEGKEPGAVIDGSDLTGVSEVASEAAPAADVSHGLDEPVPAQEQSAAVLQDTSSHADSSRADASMQDGIQEGGVRTGRDDLFEETVGTVLEESPAASTEAAAAEAPQFIGTVEVSSTEDILAERTALDFDDRAVFEHMRGFSPKLSPELFNREIAVGPNWGAETFVHALYDQTLDAYYNGEISLPAEVMSYLKWDSTAINAFVDKNASEFAEFNPFLLGKTPLDLTSTDWQEIGFSSGDPETVTPGDTIKVGEIIRRMLENAAERKY